MKTQERRVARVGLLALAALVAAPASFARVQDEEVAEEEQPPEVEEVDDSATRWFAVAGGDLYDGRGSVLRGVTVLARNGKIREIGSNVFLPEGTEVLDVTGYRVYPGLVAAASSGLFGGASDLEHTVDPFNQNMLLALASGITTAEQSNQAAKLKRGEIEDFVLNPKVFASLTYRNSDPKGKLTLFEKFEAAADYLRRHRKWQEDVSKDKELPEPTKRGVDTTALAVLRGEQTAKFSADERTDLLGIAQLAQRFGFRPVIEGCGEGWTVADELGRAGAFAIVTPRWRRWKSEQLVREGGSSIENAAILHRAGVPVAVVPQQQGISLMGIVGRDMMHLPMEVGFAVRGGLPEQAALEAITLVPARVLGVSHRVGTVEVGKDCDLIITDGDVLHYQTFVQWTVVDGEVAYDKEEELVFAHIRPRSEGALAPETRVDPGESAEPAPDADEPPAEADESSESAREDETSEANEPD